MLELCAAGDDFSGPEVLCSPSAPEKRAFECAGKAFERKLGGLYGQEEELEDLEASPSPRRPKMSKIGSDEDEDEDTDLDAAFKKAKEKRKKGKKKNKETDDDDADYYKVLGLQLLRVDADDDDIKNAYRKMSLKYHPDRNLGEDSDAAAEKFKQVSRAYETLTDPDKRRIFDSIVEDSFDDIPTGYEEGDFFECYAPVFKRFARWSEVKPVPSIGEVDADIKTVDAFYDFWFEFKSWRDFSFDDEHDPEDADSRDEKRWMERENERARKKYKKEEASKIRKLVQLAIDRDPRIIAAAANDKAEKERLRKEKYERRQAERDLEAAGIAAEEEKQRLAEEALKDKAKDDKKHQQWLKKQCQNERKKLRKIAVAATDARPEIQYELDLCLSAELEALKELTATWAPKEGNADDLIEMIQKTAGVAKDAEAAAEADKVVKAAEVAAAAKAKAEEQARANEIEWTREELRLLAKGVKKFPPGMSNRWGRINEFIGGRHPEAVVIKACKNGLPDPNKGKEDAAFDEFLKARNEGSSANREALKQEGKAGDKSVEAWEGAKLSERLHAAEEEVKKKKAQEAVKAKVQAELKAKEKVEGAAAEAVKPADVWSSEQQKALELALKKYPAADKERWDKIAADVGKTRKQVIKRCKEIRDQAKGGAPAPAEAATPAPPAAAMEWTPDEQKALEAALKAHPASDKERWDKIAADVGKTRKQVIKRCKEIRDQLKK